MGTKQNVMTPETITHEETDRSSAEIQTEIRQTRGRMDATLDELGNRLTARSIFTSALDWWDSGNQGSTAARNAVKTIYHQAKEHPMPALLIGSGIAWLVSETMSGEDEEAGTITRYRKGPVPEDAYEIHQETGVMDKVRESTREGVESARGSIESMRESAHGQTSRITEKVQHAGEAISQQAHDVVDRSKSAVSKWKEDVKEGYQSGSERFSQTCEEHPLAVGVAFAALGALAGLAIPRTRQEDELMGEQSDHLVEETREKAGDLLESGKSVGSRVIEAVKHEAEEQGLTGQSLARQISDLGDKGSHVIQKAKEEAMHAAEDEGLKEKEVLPQVEGGMGKPI
jgi:gas vesicle protein